VDEFRNVRASTEGFFQSLPAEAWDRRGVASGNPFTVRALAYIVAGHVTHHAMILREHYLQPKPGDRVRHQVSDPTSSLYGG
jgi:hypothetical protein